MDSASRDEQLKQLDKIYYNPQDPGSYGGVKRLLKRAKEVGIPEISQAKVRDYLRDQQAYTLHKPARKSGRDESPTRQTCSGDYELLSFSTSLNCWALR